MKRAAFYCIVLCLFTIGVLSIADDQATKKPPAPEASDTVRKILDEADQLTKAKQLQEALKAADRAVLAALEFKDAVGEGQAQRARALALQELRRTGEAVTAWREAAAAWERVGDGPGRVEGLATAGLLLSDGQPAEADALLAQALQLGRAESKRPLAAATVLHNMGATYYYQRGLLRPARQLFEASLIIREQRAPNSLDMAASLNGLGLVTWQQGDLTAATGYLRRALAIREQRAPNSLVVAASLNGLGNVAAKQGDLAAAADYHRRALVIQEQQAPNSLNAAASLNNLGFVAYQQGDLTAAVDYYQRALVIQQQAPNSLAVAAVLNNLGVVAWQRGDLAAAADYYRRALAIKEQQAPNSLDVAASLDNLGLVAKDQGDLAAAADYHRRALTIKEQQAPNSLEMAIALNNLGTVAEKRGDLAAAADYFRRALAIREQWAPNSLDVARSLNNLGTVAWQRGDLAAAADYHRRALAIREQQAPHSLDVATSLDNLGILADKQGNRIEAERLARQAWTLVRQQAAAITGDEARQAFGASKLSYASSLIRYQVALGETGPALTTLEEGRAQALQQLLTERQLLAKVTSNPLWSSYQKAIAERDSTTRAASKASVDEALARRQLAAKREAGATPEVLARLQASVDAAAKQLAEAHAAHTRARLKVDELWAAIKKSAPRVFVPPLSWEQAQNVLPDRTLFIAFSVGQEQGHVFLLRSGMGTDSRLSVYPLAGSVKEIEALVRAFRDQIVNVKDLNQTLITSRSLFGELFPPEAQKAIQTAQRLLISPDGRLWEVPFAALVTNTQGPPKYLGIDKALTYTPSLTLFAQSRNAAPRLVKGHEPAIIAVGNPIFDRKATLITAAASTAPRARGERHYLFGNDKPLLRLPATGIEATKIAQFYGSTALTEEQATEAAVREGIGRADVIHLATHGYFQREWPMSSGVLLTAPEKEPEIGDTNNDGVLQAWEIYSQLRLRAELVVLSACETGRGQVVRGEGLIGLMRALEYAGARSMVASQWKADDVSTLTLMVALHGNLRKGLAKDEALRQAMARVREGAGTAHPYYWAAFLLMGDPQNLNLGQVAEK